MCGYKCKTNSISKCALCVSACAMQCNVIRYYNRKLIKKIYYALLADNHEYHYVLFFTCRPPACLRLISSLRNMARSTTAHQRPWTAQQFIQFRVWELHFSSSWILSAKTRMRRKQSESIERLWAGNECGAHRRQPQSNRISRGMNAKSQFSFFFGLSADFIIHLHCARARPLALAVRKNCWRILTGEI